MAPNIANRRRSRPSEIPITDTEQRRRSSIPQNVHRESWSLNSSIASKGRTSTSSIAKDADHRRRSSIANAVLRETWSNTSANNSRASIGSTTINGDQDGRRRSSIVNAVLRETWSNTSVNNSRTSIGMAKMEVDENSLANAVRRDRHWMAPVPEPDPLNDTSLWGDQLEPPEDNDSMNSSINDTKMTSMCIHSSNESLNDGPRTFAKMLRDLRLPDSVAAFYANRNIEELYDWQDECLKDRRLLKDRSNYIISLPTSAGKTLIAELLMLRETMVNRRNCIMILPYVAIVQELVHYLSRFEKEFGIYIEEYAKRKGRIPPLKRRDDKRSIYICTIEKANSLVNSMIDADVDRVTNIGLVIVDELHMLGDGSRGATLEMCVSKLLCKSNAQIVGMSATLSNFPDLQRFLNGAHVFGTDFRPIELTEYYKIDSALYSIKTQQQMDKIPPNRHKEDPDGLFHLLVPAAHGRSVIIFCSTKDHCERTCQLITRFAHKNLKEENSEKRRKVVEELKREHDYKLDEVLEKGMLNGIAYHHADLTYEERMCIENAFKDGLIRIICATSTLAAGVNLPCRRVIIRTPMVGRSRLTKDRYLQMVGRAGRAGLEKRGESIVMLKGAPEVNWFVEMVNGPLVSCRSSLSDEGILESFYLDLIALKVCKTADDLRDTILKKTLYGIQSQGYNQKPTEDQSQNKIDVTFKIDEVLERLVNKEMIEIKSGGILQITEKGLATFSSNMSPDDALDMDNLLLKNMSGGLVLHSCFHLIFMVIPIDCRLGYASKVDWDLFFEQLTQLSPGELALLEKMGMSIGEIGRLMGKIVQPDPKSERLRAYIAFMLYEMLKGKTLWEVSKTFGISRGALQATLQDVLANTSSVLRYAEKIQALWPLKAMLPEFLKLFTQCSKKELIPLLQVDHIKEPRAKLLYSRGYRTIKEIADADPADLVRTLEGHLSYYQAERIVSSAQIIIRDRLAEKDEELAEDLGI
ncbi:DEAD/DEAH box helicase domain-containing protein [Ditylenchus destructor]|uniref:DEAD/DEAH box helicase domain-containing protein n=1 Tax=Ditylenchus destructor TaxID=166010 RepID=A0AAD4MZ80_9BILA|nr:DEAD/DEAH box helicase domain-containing protein [Ditylenchus destructor]